VLVEDISKDGAFDGKLEGEVREGEVREGEVREERGEGRREGWGERSERWEGGGERVIGGGNCGHARIGHESSDSQTSHHHFVIRCHERPHKRSPSSVVKLQLFWKSYKNLCMLVIFLQTSTLIAKMMLPLHLSCNNYFIRTTTN
jgi:hypothetical protein